MSTPSSPVLTKRGRFGLKKKIEKKSSSPAPASGGLRGVLVYKKGEEVVWGVVANMNDEAMTMENGDIVSADNIIKSFSQSFQHTIATHVDPDDKPFHPKRLLSPHTYTVLGSRGKLPAFARTAAVEAIQFCRDHPIKVRGRGTSKTQLQKEIESLKRQLDRERGK